MPDSNNTTDTETIIGPGGLLRRFAAILYDTILLFVVLYFFAMVYFLIPYALGLTDGPPEGPEDLGIVYTLYLTLAAYLYFGFQWARGGQTLGMKAWRLRALQTDHTPVTWQKAAIRFGISIVSWLAVGIGFFWMLFDKEKRTWHDWLSGTQLYLIKKEG